MVTGRTSPSARMDAYDELPTDMRRYLSAFGWHFSKGMCELATGGMRSRDGSAYAPMDKAQVSAALKQAGVTLENDVLHDACYVYNMAKSDFMGSSIKDANALALFVKDYLDDVDGTPTRAMDEYVGRMIGAGKPIDWEAGLEE